MRKNKEAEAEAKTRNVFLNVSMSNESNVPDAPVGPVIGQGLGCQAMAVFPFCQAMDDVVFAHNVTNERSWKAVLDWEKLHSKSCPRLDEENGCDCHFST